MVPTIMRGCKQDLQVRCISLTAGATYQYVMSRYVTRTSFSWEATLGHRLTSTSNNRIAPYFAVM